MIFDKIKKVLAHEDIGICPISRGFSFFFESAAIVSAILCTGARTPAGNGSGKEKSRLIFSFIDNFWSIQI